MIALRERNWLINARKRFRATREFVCAAMQDISDTNMSAERLKRIEIRNGWFEKDEWDAILKVISMTPEMARYHEIQWRNGIKDPKERARYNARNPIY